MNRTLPLAVGLVAALLAAPALAQLQPWDGKSILNDPEWQKSFLGSYGFLSGAEPDIRQPELELLREVIDLMRVDPTAAALRLEQERGGDSSAALDFILANLYFQTGQEAQARAAYEGALKKFPDFRRAHKNLGLLLVQSGEYAGGARHLGRAVELGERDGRNYGLLGFCYLNLENPLAAEEAYRNAILQEPETRDWKLGLARALLAMEKNEEASALFGSLIAENPDDPQVWLLQANALVGLERPLDAAVNLEAVRMMGGARTSSLVLLGDIYMNSQMPELAASAYVDAIASDPKATQFQTAARAAELLIRTKSFDDASRVLDKIDSQYGKALTKDQSLEVLTLRAKHARGAGREKEAAKMLESIVRQDGTRGDALLELAAYYRGSGNEEKALLMIERAENLDAYEYRALLDHAQMKAASKDYREAATLLRKALRIKHEPRVERFLTRVEDAIRRT